LKREYLLFIQDILEAIQKGEEFASAIIPWSSMAKMRDRLAHGYWTVDYEIVWKVLKEEFVELKPKIREVYEHEQKRS
jgi:uncharacterized protein with HEPN domain